MTQALTVSNVGQHVQVFDESQLEILQKTIFKGGTPNQLALFAQVCQRTGLDPFAKQIYPVIRNTKVDGKVVPVMTIQTGIDGYRLIAQRSGEWEGTTQPEWCDELGTWHDVWLSEDPPAAARIGVYRRGFREPVMFTAVYREYVQTVAIYENGQRSGKSRPNEMWFKMPANQLRKCAEAGAIRTGFPQECAGIYVDAEDGAGDHVWDAQVERETPPPVRTIAPPRATDEPFEGEFTEAGEEEQEDTQSTPLPPVDEPAPPPPAATESVVANVRDDSDEQSAAEKEPPATPPRRARNLDASEPTPIREAAAVAPTFAEFSADVDKVVAELGADFADLAMCLNIAADELALKKWWERTVNAGKIKDPVEYIRKNIQAMQG